MRTVAVCLALLCSAGVMVADRDRGMLPPPDAQPRASATAGRDRALDHDPRADAAAVVTTPTARFTVLTPQLIRMEWAGDGVFEDRPSLVFLNRRLPVPKFTTAQRDGWLTIDTGRLRLRYRETASGFAPDTLSVELAAGGRAITWHPGLEDNGNLRGTTRTLDGVSGATSLEPGLVSRDGWALVDDSGRPLFDDSDWPWVIERSERNARDWYFFGHGHEYKAALRDFVQVAGRIPIPPRFAFGAWWSRYWAYTDQELMALVRDFRRHDVPLDVLVVDMDWHLTFDLRWWENRRDQAGNRLGWSGYTWDRTLFPDPERFLAWCEEQGLKTTLNLHPASGVQPHEEAYPAMARAMGVDPASRKYIPFDITDKEFAENYFALLHHPLERQGVDFWWLDWQQQPTTRLAGVNPTWWLNYVHTSDMERRGKRPLIFHRWGGLGNHRYQIGFSGDTHSVWESLAFQPYFTATAANVGYAYWSHDIGGHMPGEVGPELYTRWIQFGVFSPVLRTHTTKNPRAERRTWAYPAEYAAAMRDAYLLRYRLVPYLYTEARKTFDTGVAFFRPLYYEWPAEEQAYTATNQYMFGDDLMVAPILEAVDPATSEARRRLWVPPGTWIDWSTGDVLDGPSNVTRRYSLEQIPVFVRAGAVLPMAPPMRHTRERPLDPLVLTIFPGEAGTTRIYEDDGESLEYKGTAFAWTPVEHRREGDGTVAVVIGPTDGFYTGMPTERGHELRLPGTLPPGDVRFRGTQVPFAREPARAAVPFWHYEGRTLTTVVVLPKSPARERIEVRIRPLAAGAEAEALTRGFTGALSRLDLAARALNETWPRGWSPEPLVRAVQTPRRLELAPEKALDELRAFRDGLPAIAEAIRKEEANASRALQYLRDDLEKRK